MHRSKASSGGAAQPELEKAIKFLQELVARSEKALVPDPPEVLVLPGSTGTQLFHKSANFSSGAALRPS